MFHWLEEINLQQILNDYSRIHKPFEIKKLKIDKILNKMTVLGQFCAEIESIEQNEVQKCALI